MLEPNQSVMYDKCLFPGPIRNPAAKQPETLAMLKNDISDKTSGDFFGARILPWTSYTLTHILDSRPVFSRND